MRKYDNFWARPSLVHSMMLVSERRPLVILIHFFFISGFLLSLWISSESTVSLYISFTSGFLLSFISLQLNLPGSLFLLLPDANRPEANLYLTSIEY